MSAIGEKTSTSKQKGTKERMSWIEKLKQRWKLKSATQVILVLIVFACTGTTVLLIKRPIIDLINPEFRASTLYTIIYLILILPVYNVLLLIFGFIFGQFKFFWEFEKRFFRRFTRKK